MNVVKPSAWCGYVSVVKNFLCDHKKDLEQNMHYLGNDISIKVDFRHRHRFQNILMIFCEEQGEQFHQDIKVMEDWRTDTRW